MVLNRYALTSTVTVPAGTAATLVAGEPATGGVGGFGNASAVSPPISCWPISRQSAERP
jgi:hypothetical protein